MLRRFGYYSTESNGHLSEYVPWYRKRPSEIMEWIDLGSWINGETGGYLRVCTEGRRWFEHDFLTTALRADAGNITCAASAVKKNRRAFWELLRKHDLLADRRP